MSRISACALLVAAGVVAAPAPRLRPPVPWVTGWDRPVGDCLVHRDAGKLTITLQGKAQAKLLRDVEGDFVVQVRVGGDFTAGVLAGILLTDGKRVVRVRKVAVAEKKGLRDYLWVELPDGERPDLPPGGCAFDGRDWCGFAKPTYLRLSRRGSRLTLTFSADAEEWLPRRQFPVQEVNLPRKLKVGVVVEAVAPGPFNTTFDQFKLAPPGSKP